MNYINVSNHYWVVAGSTTQVYSSSANVYVAVSAPAYVSWLATGREPSRVLNETQLSDILKQQAPGYLPDWLFNSTSFVQPSAGTYSKSQLKAYAADKRWQKEVGGITVSGVPVATDDRSKLMITGGRVAAVADGAWSTIWQGSDGSAYPLNAAAMIAVSTAVEDHVNDCFTTFASVVTSIDSDATTTLAQIDTAFA